MTKEAKEGFLTGVKFVFFLQTNIRRKEMEQRDQEYMVSDINYFELLCLEFLLIPESVKYFGF